MSRTVNMSAPVMQTQSAAARHRFPRTNKLLKHALFDQVYQRGQRHFSGLMTVFFLRREPGSPAPKRVSECEFQAGSRSADGQQSEAEGPRVGLTVGRVLGNSVVRNRIRRRMREAVRLNLHQLTGPVDVVINPKKAVLTAEFAPLAQEVRKAFEAVEKRSHESGRDTTSIRPDGLRSRRQPSHKGRSGRAPDKPQASPQSSRGEGA